VNIEIDASSGFCFGVTTAIQKAENQLIENRQLYCLGDIVHNGQECERLTQMGLHTITHAEMADLHHVRVLLRAHGEPPETYALAARNDIELVDATCPVVLQLQKRIRREYEQNADAQIVIFGKNGHAEVLGLVGQTDGRALVIENLEEASRLDFSRPIRLFSQTTKSLEEFWQIVSYIKSHIGEGVSFGYQDTICRQVAHRMENIRRFASTHDVIFFVSGQKSSNGKVLFEECKKTNSQTYLIAHPNEIDSSLLSPGDSVGICGATSTPKWLMENCKKKLETFAL